MQANARRRKRDRRTSDPWRSRAWSDGESSRACGGGRSGYQRLGEKRRGPRGRVARSAGRARSERVPWSAKAGEKRLSAGGNTAEKTAAAAKIRDL